MNWREKLADWISGGQLRKARWLQAQAQDNLKFYVDIARMSAEASRDRHIALTKIAALETPCANATVRKMAAIARKAP